MSTVQVAPNLTFAVIGDSAAFGTGDEAPDGTFRGWAFYLAKSFRDECNYVNFARPGAKSDEVSGIQLSNAKAYSPDICAVVAGGNDLLRNGFSPNKLHQNLLRTCRELMEQGSEVIMVELHDPNQLLRIPNLIKRILRKRVEAVNAVYRKIADELEIILIKTREIPDVHNLRNWHIDRMHPGERGHKILAREVAIQLQRRGWSLTIPEEGEVLKKEKPVQIKWLIANGVPWFLKRSVDLLPVVLVLAIIEIFKILNEKLSYLKILR
jgi:lysophospholipase L1-like esterase